MTTIRLLSSIRIYKVYIYFNIKVEMHQSYRKATGYGLGGIAKKVRRYFFSYINRWQSCQTALECFYVLSPRYYVIMFFFLVVNYLHHCFCYRNKLILILILIVQMMQSVAACTGNLKSCNNKYHHTMIIVESHV